MVRFNTNQINKYLKRLGLIQEEPSLDYLNRLQENHHLNIPFENLDVMSNKHIQLTNTHLFDKIINNNRGGFCFELNGLFGDLLNSLGFNVYMIEAGVYNEKLETFGYMRNHMALIVTIDDHLYLTDVGFGDSFRKPISLREKKTEDVSGKYRIVSYEAYHYRSGQDGKIQEKYDYFILEHSTGTEWGPQYKFHYKQNLNLKDYQENCNWIESSPDSGFTQGRTWSIAKKDGRVSLSENGITVTHYLQQAKTKYENEKDFEYYLKKNIE
ncbi:MAG: arylamine N-acetyltransferase [Candidatus Heimdallarchaeota archaeon]|nr:arylamine N-acetyltransferase [Candidatus Heimdallarchaeota archaeon]